MKKILFIVCAIFLTHFAKSQQQKIVGDCTVTYTVSQSGASENSGLAASSKIVYIKGMYSRSDLISPSFSQSIIYNQNSGTAVILRTVSQNKYITNLDAPQWQRQNEMYEGMQLSLAADTKTILGYECKKAVATLKSGSTYTIWYATSIKPSVPEIPFQFKNVPGFVLEYESAAGKSSNKIIYTATKINLTPLPASVFTIPTSGYKELKPEN